MSALSTLPIQQQMSEFYLTGPKMTIASLYPLGILYHKAFKSEPDGGHLTQYNLEPHKEGPPVIIKVGAGAQHTYIGEKRWGDVWEDARSIAVDVVRNARSVPLSTGAMGPAIWVCEGSEPTQAEVTRNLNQQIVWCRARIVQADDWFLGGHRSQIGDLDRTLAAWMKIDPRAHPWVKLQERLEVTPCPFCRTEMDVLAAICPQCTRVANPRRLKEIEAMLESVADEKEALSKEILTDDSPNALKDLLASSPKPKNSRN